VKADMTLDKMPTQRTLIFIPLSCPFAVLVVYRGEAFHVVHLAYCVWMPQPMVFREI